MFKIVINVTSAADAIKAYEELKAAGLASVASVTSGNKKTRFRMSKEQKAQFDSLPEDEQEAYRAGCMQAAGFNQEENAQEEIADDGRDVLA